MELDGRVVAEPDVVPFAQLDWATLVELDGTVVTEPDERVLVSFVEPDGRTPAVPFKTVLDTDNVVGTLVVMVETQVVVVPMVWAGANVVDWFWHCWRLLQNLPQQLWPQQV